MHVVMVVPGGVDRGGVERVIPALLAMIDGFAKDHRVTVVALGQEPIASVYPLLGATVVNVPPERRGPHRLARQLWRAVRACSSQGSPDIVFGMWASVSGLAAVLAARRHRVPSIVHVAGGELVAMDDISYGGALGRGGRLIGSTCVRRATAVTVASHWMADHVAAHGRKVSAVIPLGTDVTRFVPISAGDLDPPTGRPPATQPANGTRLIHVASLNRVKDQTTLLNALALVRRSHPDVTLDCVGVDTLGGAMSALARQLDLTEAVHFHGFVPHASLPPLYAGAALHVISSRHEAGPLSAVEAAACGVPTVGTAVGHIADLAAANPPAAVAVPVAIPAAVPVAVPEGLSAAASDPTDTPSEPLAGALDAGLDGTTAGALAAAIIGLLDDPDRRRALGDAARQWAVANSQQHTVERFLDLFEQLVSPTAFR